MKITYCSHFLAVLTLSVGLITQTAAAQTDAVCQSQVLSPAQFRPSSENVIVHEPSTRYTTTPLQMGYGESKVKVADAYLEYTIIPAKFGEVTETIEVERERVEIETLPATYRTETKRLKIKEATKRWNPNCPAFLAEQGNLPENCLLEVPAEYTNVTREVIDTPARTVKKVIPARTETITRKVLLEPAKIVRKEIPAVYTTIKIARVEQPAKITTSQQTAKTQSIPIQQTMRPERLVTMPALCEAAISPETIQRLQTSLQQRGYYPETPDGELGTKTRTALTRFQEDNNLASGAITLETLQKLQLQ